MNDTLFTSDLMALRKRRANVGRELRLMQDCCSGHHRYNRPRRALMRQLRRTFYHLTVIELRLADKVLA